MLMIMDVIHDIYSRIAFSKYKYVAMLEAVRVCHDSAASPPVWYTRSW